MITIDIRPAKRRFSKRKQWKYETTGGNGEKLSDRDTYANVGDIVHILHALREDEVQVRVHYAKGVETFVWSANPPSPF